MSNEGLLKELIEKKSAFEALVSLNASVNNKPDTVELMLTRQLNAINRTIKHLQRHHA